MGLGSGEAESNAALQRMVGQETAFRWVMDLFNKGDRPGRAQDRTQRRKDKAFDYRADMQALQELTSPQAQHFMSENPDAGLEDYIHYLRGKQ